MNKLNKNVNLYVFVVRTIFALIYYGLYALVIFVPRSEYEVPFLKDFFLIFGGILLVIAVVYQFVIPFFTYKLYSYELKEEELVIKRGVLFRKTTILPIKRIQHVEKLQGPIETLFKLSTVRVFTAGSLDVVFGLSIEQALNLVTELNSKLNVFLKLEEAKDE